MNWYKTANPNNIFATLRIPLPVAKIITKKVGDKWDFIVARWFLNYSGVTSLAEDYDLPMSDYGGEYNLALMESIGMMTRLVNVPEEKRPQIARQNEKFLYYYFRKYGDLWPNVNFKQFAETELDKALDDELLPFALEEATEKFNDKFDHFIATDFFRELIANQTFNKQYCKNLNYGEAVKEYLDQVKVRNMPVILDLGEYRWANAGTGLSEYVRDKMKNCGKANWGALRHANPEENNMLILLDSHDNPHIMATWVPEYVDYERPDDVPKKFIGGIQGVGSSVAKQKYYPQIKALFEHLKPDVASVSRSSQGGMSNGEVVYESNQNLRDYLGLEDDDHYNISPYPGSVAKV